MNEIEELDFLKDYIERYKEKYPTDKKTIEEIYDRINELSRREQCQQ